jgi:uncharacterized protein (TIGR02145 family)
MTGYCLIDFEASAQGETTLELYDIAGKRIAEVQEFLIKGLHTYSVSGIGSGLYVLKVESAQYTYSAKIVSTNPSSVFSPQLLKTENCELKTVPSANTEALKSLKSNKSYIVMQYTSGDTLKLTGFSNIYTTVFMLVPTKSQTVTFNFILCADGDNNNYAVVQIETQIWMEENLKTTKYKDGSLIPVVTDSTRITPGYCWYNDSVKYKNIYGALYNWYTVNAGKLCPTGWHVPSDSEWIVLVTYLGAYVAGGKMKDTCSTYWVSPNTGATNSSGFSALPCGFRSNTDTAAFHDGGYSGYWWSSKEYGSDYAWGFSLGFDYPGVGRLSYGKDGGFSMRCLRG